MDRYPQPVVTREQATGSILWIYMLVSFELLLVPKVEMVLHEKNYSRKRLRPFFFK